MSDEQEKCPEPSPIERAAHNALNHIIYALLKWNESPMSAMTHQDQAIVELLEVCPDWRPADKESKQITEQAKAHMEYYRKPPNAGDKGRKTHE